VLAHVREFIQDDGFVPVIDSEAVMGPDALAVGCCEGEVRILGVAQQRGEAIDELLDGGGFEDARPVGVEELLPVGAGTVVVGVDVAEEAAEFVP
jgi:hypothetical protein